MLLISSQYVESPYIKQVVEKSLFKKWIGISFKINVKSQLFCFIKKNVLFEVARTFPEYALKLSLFTVTQICLKNQHNKRKYIWAGLKFLGKFNSSSCLKIALVSKSQMLELFNDGKNLLLVD